MQQSGVGLSTLVGSNSARKLELLLSRGGAAMPTAFVELPASSMGSSEPETVR